MICVNCLPVIHAQPPVVNRNHQSFAGILVKQEGQTGQITHRMKHGEVRHASRHKSQRPEPMREPSPRHQDRAQARQTHHHRVDRIGKPLLQSDNTRATDNGRGKPARHGQNEQELAINRKNALFAGHDAGAQNWAVIASLIETCKLNRIEPHGYLSAVLTAIAQGHKQIDTIELLPWNHAKNVSPAHRLR